MTRSVCVKRKRVGADLDGRRIYADFFSHGTRIYADFFSHGTRIYADFYGSRDADLTDHGNPRALTIRAAADVSLSTVARKREGGLIGTHAE